MCHNKWTENLSRSEWTTVQSILDNKVTQITCWTSIWGYCCLLQQGGHPCWEVGFACIISRQLIRSCLSRLVWKTGFSGILPHLRLMLRSLVKSVCLTHILHILRQKNKSHDHKNQTSLHVCLHSVKKEVALILLRAVCVASYSGSWCSTPTGGEVNRLFTGFSFCDTEQCECKFWPPVNWVDRTIWCENTLSFRVGALKLIARIKYQKIGYVGVIYRLFDKCRN